MVTTSGTVPFPGVYRDGFDIIDRTNFPKLRVIQHPPHPRQIHVDDDAVAVVAVAPSFPPLLVTPMRHHLLVN